MLTPAVPVHLHSDGCADVLQGDLSVRVQHLGKFLELQLRLLHALSLHDRRSMEFHHAGAFNGSDAALGVGLREQKYVNRKVGSADGGVGWTYLRLWN